MLFPESGHRSIADLAARASPIRRAPLGGVEVHFGFGLRAHGFNPHVTDAVISAAANQ